MKRLISIFLLVLLATAVGCSSGDSPFSFVELKEPVEKTPKDSTPPPAHPPPVQENGPVESLVIAPGAIILQGNGTTVQLAVNIRLDDGSLITGAKDQFTPPKLEKSMTVTWSSGNSKLVAVDSQGKVTAVSPGDVLITATAEKKQATARIVVVNPPPSSDPADDSDSLPIYLDSVTIEPLSFRLDKIGDAQQLTARLTFSDKMEVFGVKQFFSKPVSGEIEWKSSDPLAYTVSETGLLKRLAPTASTITVSAYTNLDLVKGTLEMDENGFTPIIEKSPLLSSDRYINGKDKVVVTKAGKNGGHNQSKLPAVVSGPPKGGFSSEVYSLGCGGEVLIELKDYIIFDGAGVDFTIFENPASSDVKFAEPAFVEVSYDGITYKRFGSCDPEKSVFSGCAGVKPVLANSLSNKIDPFDPKVSGGDQFDLSAVGLTAARFIRIKDANPTCMGVFTSSPYAGFDLDAMAIIHGSLLK